jgi:putative endonuclease
MYLNSSDNERKYLGDCGEELVARWLEGYGFSILARNYRTKEGEIDIIAQRLEVVAFVEVKTRETEYFDPANAVTFRKQKRIIKAAQSFIFSKKIIDKVLRFDVATVIYEDKDRGKYSIKYIRNAFTVSR